MTYGLDVAPFGIDHERSAVIVKFELWVFLTYLPIVFHNHVARCCERVLISRRVRAFCVNAVKLEGVDGVTKPNS
jgi:hypothetical protein